MNEYSTYVTSVIGGDTFNTSINTSIKTVRLANINTPESGTPQGRKSANYLKMLVEGKRVVIKLSDNSVRSYIHKYNTSGLEDLMPESPPGRRGKITHFSRSDWERLFEQTPNQYEKLQTDSRHWTLELIRVYFLVYHEISITPSAICMALRRTGYRTGRSKLRVGSPDPEYQVKRSQLAELTSLRKRDD